MVCVVWSGVVCVWCWCGVGVVWWCVGAVWVVCGWCVVCVVWSGVVVCGVVVFFVRVGIVLVPGPEIRLHFWDSQLRAILGSHAE